MTMKLTENFKKKTTMTAKILLEKNKHTTGRQILPP